MRHKVLTVIRLKLLLYLVLPVLLLATSCSDEEPYDENSDSFRTINIADSLGLDSGEATVFLLPAPLQVASALKLHDVPYDASLINDFEESQGNAPEYSNALNLGCNIIDLGYATVNGDIQLGLSYSQNIKTLMNELGITSLMTKTMIERFEANQANQDSLSKIILEAYGESHEFFQRNEREGMGLLILTGCFIEGLYLASSVEEISSNGQIQSLLGIHKEYLQNILLLVKYYNQNKEVASLIEQLKLLESEFNTVDLVVDAASGSARLNSALQPEKITAIRDEISEIRNRIRAPSY